jgi:nitroreductase
MFSMLTPAHYNEPMDILLSRASVKELGEPGPSDADLRLIFEAAVRAPDHGKLRPWRFFVIRGAAREKLSELFATSLLRREPGVGAAEIEKERGKPLRAPVTIAVVARVLEGHKIPVIEQVLAAGAAAMNILNAAHALGYGAKWVTGANCYDADFRVAFGLEPGDRLLGFIHIGTGGATMETARPDPGAFVTEWQ